MTVAPASRSVSRPRPPWQLLDRLLGRQHGVVALWQLTPFGMSRMTFLRYAERHGFEQLGYGLHAAAWSTDSFARDCVIERLGGPSARLLTGPAPLVLLGVRGTRPDVVDLWCGPGRHVGGHPGARFHRGAWWPGERGCRVLGHPATPVLRWLRDAARVSSVDRLVRDIAGLDRLRLATPQQIVANLEQGPPFRGKPKLLEAAVGSVASLAHSQDERAARALLAPLGARMHPRPLLIEHSGWKLAEVDIPFCALRYGVEVDGPWHELDGAMERDAARDARLELLDWRIDRFGHDRIRARPREFVEAVRRGLAAAEARRPAPWPCSSCGT